MGQFNGKNEVGRLTGSGQNACSDRGLVDRTFVVVGVGLVVFFRKEVDDWHVIIHLPMILILKYLILRTPLGTLYKKPIYINSIFWRPSDLILICLLPYLEAK